MKFILELLTERGQTVVCGNRGEAITRLDSYPDHRPGQPIAAVYIKDGERKALLALGHDYGIGLEGSKRKYTVIGDVDATNSVTTTVTADQIKLREIDYSGLLDDLQLKEGKGDPEFHRFGWLGTVNDPWLSSLKVPNGASVQDAFDAILLGRLDHGGGDEDPTLKLTANPTYIEITATEQKTYTVTANATYNGSLTAASMTVTNGTAPTNFFDRMRDYKSWSGTYTVTAQTLGLENPGDEITISYNATITANGKTAPDSCSVTIKLIGDQPTPPGPTSDKYYVIYEPYGNDTGNTDRKGPYSSIPQLLNSVPSGWSKNGYRFDGWSLIPNGPKVTSLVAGDFVDDPTDQTIHTATVYPLWIEDEPEIKKLVLILPDDVVPYDGVSHTYRTSLIQVKDTDGNTVNPSDYTLVWTPDQISALNLATGTDVKTYTSPQCLQAISNDPSRYSNSDLGSVTLKITALNAAIYTLIDGETTQTYQIGHATPTETFEYNGFLSEDRQIIDAITGWKSWSPQLNMNAAGTYTLSFLQSTVPESITKNYNITYQSSILTVQDVPRSVTFTTTGYTNEPAVHQPDLSGTNFIHKTATANGLTGNVNDWWIFVSDRRSQSQYTTYIYSNKSINTFSIMRWDSAANVWRDMSSQLPKFTVDSSTNTITFKYYDEDDERWEVETSLYAIKFN